MIEYKKCSVDTPSKCARYVGDMYFIIILNEKAIDYLFQK